MLELKNIYKNYLVDKKPFPALKNINLNFDKKGFVSILGPSGCGKTTLLNLIGGLDQYTSGDLIINNKSTKHFTDKDWDAYRNKRVGFVFQSYNLVPHLTIEGNVEISMALSGISKKARAKKALKALEQVGLKDIAKKKPNQLSGGQMQRVAIARSLVNDPEIILADEPTGALDSVTSVQVLEILKAVSKTHLVIMVTHNTELADKYSTRIIRLKDGVIISDSKPEKLKQQKELELEDNKHTHMSFLTALASSARSLLTKKGRATLTAVAASFGIIGVSLVLALSNGFTNYVKRVELSTASTVPITISPYVPTNTRDVDSNWTAWPDEDNIIPFDDDMSGGMAVHHNIITKEFSNYCKKLTESPTHYAYSVLENHEGLDFNILTKKPNDQIIKVDQYTSSGATGSILSTIGGLPSSIFHELYGGRDYIDSLYDVVAGHYPENKNELLVVCDRYNRIPATTLAKLGIINSETEKNKISFNDILKKEYKGFMPDIVYPAGNKITKTISSSYSLANSNITPFPHGNPESLPDLFKLNSASSKTIYQYSEPDYNALYDESIDNENVLGLKVVGIIRPSRTSLINLMPGSVCYTSELKDYYVKAFEDGKGADLKEAMLNNWAITDDTAWNSTCNKIKTLISEALQDEKKLAAAIAQLAELKDEITYYGITTTSKDATPTPIAATETMSAYDIYATNCYKFSTEFKAFNFVNDVLIGSTTNGIGIGLRNDKSIVDALSNINGYSTITSILIFPKDLANKPHIFDYIAQYNETQDEEHQIVYSDIAGSITDAVGTLIQMISIVLVAFSSVSLLVSCVMTGVITYTSVLERTKEIGILRAIGARKKDVGRLFEAESMIIGALGGIIGIIITYIAEGPINIVINRMFPEQNVGTICDFHPLHAFLLIGISVLLTFVSGFIPARKAAKKDPVVALRTE